MKKIKKQFANWRKRIKKKTHKILAENVEIKTPSLEDCAFAFLIIFSLTFSALLFGIGSQIQNEEFLQKSVPATTKFEKNISLMVSNHPIESMIPYIAQKDKKVAAYMVAIAKKESNWGKYSPQKNGRGCFNYWGYRGTYNQTASGYSCFKNPRQAVNVVGGRIEDLLKQNINTPSEMVVWKCGQDCSGQDAESVEKWIKDVAYYHEKVESVF